MQATKEKQLERVNREIAQCPLCPIGKIGKVVVGEGSASAKIAFIGEAPGKKEAETGRPFVGRSGQLLRSLIRSKGLKEEDVYITSAVKYLPTKGTPSPSDIRHGAVHLEKQLAIIRPQLIVLLGATAAKALLKKPIAVTKVHGQTFIQDGQKYIVMFHPAAALRFPPLKKELEKDFSAMEIPK